MNPITNIKSLNKLIDNEIRLGRVGTKVSWHEQYRQSAWCFFGGVPFELTEGDLICIFSQYGEIVNLNLIRDQKTGKSKGFGFVCYEDQRSTDLAVDNFNGTKILDRMIRVDHVLNYKPPKDNDDLDDMTKFLREEGCAPSIIEQKKEKIEQFMEKKSKIKDEYKRRDRNDEHSNRDRNYDRNRESKDVYAKNRSYHEREYSSKYEKRHYDRSRRRSRSNSSSKSRSNSSRVEKHSSKSYKSSHKSHDYKKRKSSSPDSRSPRDRQRSHEYGRDEKNHGCHSRRY